MLLRIRHLHIILLLLIYAWFIVGCGSAPEPSGSAEEVSDNIKRPVWSSMEMTGHLTPEYATEYAVDYFGDYSLITISGTDRYLLIPENQQIPSGLDSDIIPIHRPETIYLAASSAMDYFRALRQLNRVRMTSTLAVNWSLPEVTEALDKGTMLYAGKYSTPDYELLLSEGTDLAVESTMIYHSPETREKIEKLGIPVLVDKSSYEKHPLGRMEWIRLYGLLLGVLADADNFYRNQLNTLEEIPELKAMLLSDLSDTDPSGPSVAYFYITSSGGANIRRPGDYISRMIELAGGTYTFRDVAVSDESAQATMNIQMESFLDRALKSDILIYSSSIDHDVNTAEDLYNKVPMLTDSSAAETGNIWITGKNMYQQTTAVAQMMMELHAVITGTADESRLEFLHRLY